MGTITPFFKYLGPAQFRRFLVRLLPFPLLKSLEVIVNIMEEEGTNMLRTQQKNLADEVEESDTKDIISILCKDSSLAAHSHYADHHSIVRANRTSVESERMSNEELIAQTSYVTIYA